MKITEERLIGLWALTAIVSNSLTIVKAIAQALKEFIWPLLN